VSASKSASWCWLRKRSYSSATLIMKLPQVKSALTSPVVFVPVPNPGTGASTSTPQEVAKIILEACLRHIGGLRLPGHDVAACLIGDFVEHAAGKKHHRGLKERHKQCQEWRRHQADRPQWRRFRSPPAG